MKKFKLITTIMLLLFALSAPASAISLQIGLAYCNSNLYMENSESMTSDLDARLGVAVAASFPISPLMEIQAGLTYYTAASSKDMEDLIGDKQSIGLMPIEIAAKFSIPGLGMTGMNPYAGVGINYTTWTPDPAFDSAFAKDLTAGLGYYAFVGASFGNLFAELGYTWMRGSLKVLMPSEEDVNLESRGVYLKGGMLLGI